MLSGGDAYLKSQVEGGVSLWVPGHPGLGGRVLYILTFDPDMFTCKYMVILSSPCTGNAQ